VGCYLSGTPHGDAAAEGFRLSAAIGDRGEGRADGEEAAAVLMLHVIMA
jgi:hypothetical protein